MSDGVPSPYWFARGRLYRHDEKATLPIVECMLRTGCRLGQVAGLGHAGHRSSTLLCPEQERVITLLACRPIIRIRGDAGRTDKRLIGALGRVHGRHIFLESVLTRAATKAIMHLALVNGQRRGGVDTRENRLAGALFFCAGS